MSDDTVPPESPRPPEEQPEPEDDYSDLLESVRFTGYGTSRKIQVISTKLPAIAKDCLKLMIPLFQPATRHIITRYEDDGFIYKTTYETLLKNILSVRGMVEQSSDSSTKTLIPKILEAECEANRMIKFIKIKTAALDAELNRGNVKVSDF